MANIENLPLSEGPHGLMVPSFELPPLEGILGNNSVQYTFDDVYNVVDVVFTKNADPDNPEPLGISQEGKLPVFISRQTQAALKSDPFSYPESAQYSIDTTAGDLAFNLLSLKTVTRRFKDDGVHSPGSISRRASADADPWALTDSFDINANHWTVFGADYPGEVQIKLFHNRAEAVLRLLGVSSPSINED